MRKNMKLIKGAKKQSRITRDGKLIVRDLRHFGPAKLQRDPNRVGTSRQEDG